MLNLILLLPAALLSCWGIYKQVAGTWEEGELRISGRAYRLWLAAAVLIAVFIRIYRFGAVPGGFNQDGAMAVVDAKALADYGTDRFGMRWPVHLTAWGYGQMSALLSYLLVPVIKLLGISAVTVRLPQLIISLLGLLTLYLFIRDVFGKGPALLVLLFGAICPWHILQSRWILDCNLYPHFFVFGLYFLNKALGGKHRRTWLCISMLMFGLCMYCYGISIYTMPVFLLMACVYLLAGKKLSVGEALLALAVWLAVAWPFILVMAINFFQWETIETPLFTLPYFPNSVRSNDILFFSGHIGTQLIQNIKSMVDITILQGDDLLWNNIPGFGTMYKFSMPFALVGLTALVKALRRNGGAVLLGLFLLTGIWCGICTNDVNINRLNIIYYPMMALVGLGIYKVLGCIRVPFGALGLGLAYLLAFALFTNTYFTSYARQMEYCFMKDFGQAVTALKDSDAEKLYITANSQSRNSANVSEILTLFYHETDAEYFQGKREISGLLPYAERYTYSNISQREISPEEDAAYVVTADELKYFPETDYTAEQYGRYYVVRRK